MTTMTTALGRLEHHWVYGNFLAALLLLALTPVLARDWSLAQTLVFLHLPVYMLHQYEEHDDDRFAKFVNDVLGGGREILPASVIFLVNIPALYLINLAAIWLALTVDPGWGLLATYLVLVNALAHIVQAIAMRRYNPGLGTAVVLFVPLSILTLWVLISSGHASPLQHLIGILVALLVHGALLGYAARRRRALAPVAERQPQREIRQ